MDAIMDDMDAIKIVNVVIMLLVRHFLDMYVQTQTSLTVFFHLVV